MVKNNYKITHTSYKIIDKNNKIIGSRETHRIVIEVIPEKAPMGKVIKDHGGIIL